VDAETEVSSIPNHLLSVKVWDVIERLKNLKNGHTTLANIKYLYVKFFYAGRVAYVKYLKNKPLLQDNITAGGSNSIVVPVSDLNLRIPGQRMCWR